MNDQTVKQGGLRAVLQRLVSGLETFASIVIVIMMVLTFVDVIGRYLFAEPIFGAAEMISALLAMSIFAGLGVTNARDDHIVVELFDSHIKRLAPRAYEIVIQSFSVIAMALIAFVLLEIAFETYHQGARTYVLEMPLVYIAACSSGLAAISVVSQIMGLILRATDGQGADI